MRIIHSAQGARMRGVILAIASDGTYGQISAENGQRYSYWTSEVRNGKSQVGLSVDFQIENDQPIDIFILPPAVAASGSRRVAPPSVIQTIQPQSSFPPFNYWLTLFTSPSGRISRRQFWLHGFLPIFLAQLLLGWIPLINILVFLAGFWGSICISFKRFHDRGYAGAWSLLYLIPMFLASGFAVMAIFDEGRSLPIAGVIGLIGGVITIAQLVLVYLRVGQPGENRYGPDPLAGPLY
jgi:uncharacterized membrane protein YhaH (DUF805 family)